MKQLAVLTAILFCSSIAFAQQQPPVAGGLTNSGTLSWSSGLFHDFGKIKQNEPASYTFEFTNTGKDPVIITNAKPSCSCTVPEYTKDPVLPGKKGIVKATFNAHNPGVFSKTIAVTTDKGETVVLKISGEVIQGVIENQNPQK
jgi:hypothetical protein